MNPIGAWRAMAGDQVSETEAVLTTARQASALGVKAYDALHVGCAVAGGAAIFVSPTTPCRDASEAFQG